MQLEILEFLDCHKIGALVLGVDEDAISHTPITWERSSCWDRCPPRKVLPVEQLNGRLHALGVSRRRHGARRPTNCSTYCTTLPAEGDRVGERTVFL